MLNELKGNKYSIGFIIKYLREKQNMTQQELFEASGVSVSYICRIETHEKRNISMYKMYKLSQGLKVEVSKITDLLDFEDAVY